tara:strand:+ start:1047 stop:1220 length:174 start_codon:yes stop_codon:yes gene_type:complete
MGRVLKMKLGTKEDLERLNLNGPCVGPYIRTRNLEKIPGGLYDTFKTPLPSLKKQKD